MSGQREEPVNKAEKKVTYSICGEGHKVLGNSSFLWKCRHDVTEGYQPDISHNVCGGCILTSLACSRNHALADSALVMVSWVVNVCKLGGQIITKYHCLVQMCLYKRGNGELNQKMTHWQKNKNLLSSHPLNTRLHSGVLLNECTLKKL